MTARVTIAVPGWLIFRRYLWRRLRRAIREHPGPDQVEVVPRTFEEPVAFVLPDRVDGPAFLRAAAGLLAAVEDAEISFELAGGGPPARTDKRSGAPPAPSSEVG